jgi:hypothetical protein
VTSPLPTTEAPLTGELLPRLPGLTPPPTPTGLRTVTHTLRRLIDGPPGRHRAR